MRPAARPGPVTLAERMSTLSCPACLYTATRTPGAPDVVVQPGGVRRASGHPSLAAWRRLHAARSGTGASVVGPCPKCGQPLLTDEAAAPHPAWTLDTPLGAFQVNETITHPDGTVLSDAEASELLEDLLRKRMVIAPFSFVLQSIFLTMGLAPILLWLVATFVALWMFTQMAQGNLYR